MGDNVGGNMKKNIMVSGLRNARGTSLLGILVALPIGLIVVGGIGRSLVGFAERTKNLDNKRAVMEVKRSATSMLKSKAAWKASVEIALTDKNNQNQCYPGGSYTDDNGDIQLCDINLWYNPSNPKEQLEYNLTETQGGNLKRWVCSYRKAGELIHGVAMFRQNGEVIYLEEEDCESCNENNPEVCVDTRLSLNGKYIAVHIKPVDIMQSYHNIANFQMNLADIAGSGKISTFFFVGEQDQKVLPEFGHTCTDKKVMKGISNEGEIICEDLFTPTVSDSLICVERFIPGQELSENGYGAHLPKNGVAFEGLTADEGCKELGNDFEAYAFTFLHTSSSSFYTYLLDYDPWRIYPKLAWCCKDTNITGNNVIDPFDKLDADEKSHCVKKIWETTNQPEPWVASGPSPQEYQPGPENDNDLIYARYGICPANTSARFWTYADKLTSQAAIYSTRYYSYELQGNKYKYLPKANPSLRLNINWYTKLVWCCTDDTPKQDNTYNYDEIDLKLETPECMEVWGSSTANQLCSSDAHDNYSDHPAFGFAFAQSASSVHSYHTAQDLYPNYKKVAWCCNRNWTCNSPDYACP